MDTTQAQQKEPTLQVVLDALKLTPFYKAFEITADVPEIYKQEFRVTNSIHHTSLCFKINGKSHTVNVDNFRDMLQICLKLPCQKFEDHQFEKEILSFIRDLGHTREIKVLSDVNVNHMHQPWRSFAAIINKCLSDHQFEKEILSFIKDLGHTREIKVLSDVNVNHMHQPWRSFAAIINKCLSGLETLSEIALSKAEQMKITTKRSKTQFHSFHASRLGAHDGTGVSPGVPNVPTYDSNDEQISWKSNNDKDDDDDVDNQGDDDQDDDNEQTKSDNDDDIFVHPKLSTFDEEERRDEKLDEDKEGSDNVEEEKLDEDKTNEEESDRLRDEAQAKNEDFINKLDENIKKIIKEEVRTSHAVAANPSELELKKILIDKMESNKSIHRLDQQKTLYKALIDAYETNKLILETYGDTEKVLVITALKEQLNKLKGKAVLTEAVSLNPIDPELLKVDVAPLVLKLRKNRTAHTDYIKHTQDEAATLREIIESERLFSPLNTSLDYNLTTNDEIPPLSITTLPLPPIPLIHPLRQTSVFTLIITLTKTSHAVAANPSELELKKILIDKMESNKSIHRLDQQKTLYKALIDAYETNKLILETYGDTVTFKRCRDDEDDDEEPFAGSNQGSKRRRAGKELESSSAPKEKTSKATGKSNKGSKSHQKSTGKSAQANEPIHTTEDMEEPAPQETIQVLLKINLLKRPFSFLIGFRNQQSLQLPIMIGTRLYLLLMDQFKLGSAIWLRKKIPVIHLMSCWIPSRLLSIRDASA
nr:hypothetical protein [Tanacetum cinerariifolium]